MKNIVILISGSGSNMQAIVEAARAQRWAEKQGAQVVAVFSNRQDATGLAWARTQGLAAQSLDHKAFDSRAHDLAEVQKERVADRKGHAAKQRQGKAKGIAGEHHPSEVDDQNARPNQNRRQRNAQGAGKGGPYRQALIQERPPCKDPDPRYRQCQGPPVGAHHIAIPAHHERGGRAYK